MMAAACLGCFVLTLSATLAAGYWIWVRQPAQATAAGQAPGRRSRQAFSSSLSGLWETIAHVGARLPVGEARRVEAKGKLVAAGYRVPAGVSIYFGLKYGLAVAAPALLCPLLFAVRPDAFAVGFAGALASYAGFRLPSWIVGFSTRGRQQQIREALPDLIDLLVIGVDSGLSLDQALGDAARALEPVHPELTEELYVYRLETDAGTERAEALRNLGRRTGEPDLRKFGSLLIQTERFGTGISRLLRGQARSMRLRRRLRAEELARQLAVKMIFPIFFLILPSTFLVTAGPAMLYLFGDLRRVMGAE
jgi:tight adherence protein C